MKRTANLLVIAALSSVYGTELAAASPTIPEGTQEFPPIQASETYMDRHSESAKTQRRARTVERVNVRSDSIAGHLHDAPRQRHRDAKEHLYPSSARD